MEITTRVDSPSPNPNPNPYTKTNSLCLLLSVSFLDLASVYLLLPLFPLFLSPTSTSLATATNTTTINTLTATASLSSASSSASSSIWATHDGRQPTPLLSGLFFASYAPGHLLASLFFGWWSDFAFKPKSYLYPNMNDDCPSSWSLALQIWNHAYILPFLASSFLLLFSSLLFLLSIHTKSLDTAIAARFFMGLAGGGLFTLCLSMSKVNHSDSGLERRRVASLQTAAQSIAEIVAPVLGGLLYSQQVGKGNGAAGEGIGVYLPFLGVSLIALVLVALTVWYTFIENLNAKNHAKKIENCLLEHPDPSSTSIIYCPFSPGAADTTLSHDDTGDLVELADLALPAVTDNSLSLLLLSHDNIQYADADRKSSKDSASSLSDIHPDHFSTYSGDTEMDLSTFFDDHQDVRPHSYAPPPLSVTSRISISSAAISLEHYPIDTCCINDNVQGQKEDDYNNTIQMKPNQTHIIMTVYGISASALFLLAMVTITLPVPVLSLEFTRVYKVDSGLLGLYFLYYLAPKLIFGGMAFLLAEIRGLGGVKGTAVLGMVLASTGSLLSALLTSPESTWRTANPNIFGLSLSVMFGGNYLCLVILIPLVSDLFSNSLAGMSGGYVNLLYSVGLFVGSFLGSIVYDVGGWNFLALLALGVNLCSLVLVLLCIDSGNT